MNYKEIIGSVFSLAAKIVLIVIACMFIYKYAVMAYDIGYRVFSEDPVGFGEGHQVIVSIGENTSGKEVGRILEEKGLIRDKTVFFFQELASENHGKIQAGKYELNTNMTADEMIRIMAGADKPKTEEELLYNEDEEVLDLEEMLESTAQETDEILPPVDEDTEGGEAAE